MLQYHYSVNCPSFLQNAWKKKRRNADARRKFQPNPNGPIVWIWIQLKSNHVCVNVLSSGSHTLFIGPASTKFGKINFKTVSHGTIHVFKNYFVTVFSVFSNKRYPNKPIISRIKYVDLMYIIKHKNVMYYKFV